MLTIIAGVCIAGSTLLARKLYTSFSGVLELSEDLDPLRPQAHSEVKMQSQATSDLVHGMIHSGMIHDDAPYSESILRLSGALAGSNSKQMSEQPEAAVAVGSADPR